MSYQRLSIGWEAGRRCSSMAVRAKVWETLSSCPTVCRRSTYATLINRRNLGWRTRWRIFRAERPTIGTWSLIGMNTTIWGLYSVAPASSPQFSTLWGRITRQPRSEQQTAFPRLPTSWEEFRQQLPKKAFFERHFFSSYHAVSRQERYETIPLCTFMHVDGWHLLFNMVNLFFFGRQLERSLGLARYLAVYTTSGLVAVSSQLYAAHKERHDFLQCIGASGGVYAVMAFVTCMAPWQTVLLYAILPVPMWLVLAGLVAADVLYLRPNDAHVAHLVGVGCGVIFCILTRRP